MTTTTPPDTDAREALARLMEVVARAVDPQKWRTLDGMLAQMKPYGHDPLVFRDRASLGVANEILSLFRSYGWRPPMLEKDADLEAVISKNMDGPAPGGWEEYVSRTADAILAAGFTRPTDPSKGEAALREALKDMARRLVIAIRELGPSMSPGALASTIERGTPMLVDRCIAALAQPRDTQAEGGAE